jgi:polyhydroxyalkanoate synthesis repressor PhaR
MSTDTTPGTERPRRIIKRYSNRKLYDTKDSRYVTLAQIAELVRGGEDVQVIDNASKEDKTEATLALIISEEVKSRPKAVPLSTLRDLVHARSEKLLTQLREGPIGRLMGQPEGVGPDGLPLKPGSSPPPPDGTAGSPAVVAPPPEPRPSERVGTRLQELVESSKQTIDQWQAAIDERVKAVLPGFFRDLQGDVKTLTRRVEELESRLKTALDQGDGVAKPSKSDKQ